MTPTLDDPQLSALTENLQNTLIFDEKNVEGSIDIIDATALIDRINQYLVDIEKLIISRQNISHFNSLKKEYDILKNYLWHPELVKNAMPFDGVYHIHQQYEAQLLRASFILQDFENRISTVPSRKVVTPVAITVEESRTAVRGFGLLAHFYKMKKAYLAIASGTKFRKAQSITITTKPLLQQDNPIAALSKENIQRLIKELSKTGPLKFGLQRDELVLFEVLMNLDLRCQHATNFFYPMANAGSIDSLTELKRKQPNYVSPFSTNGNLNKLGNGGFVFFRVYVHGVNSEQTRYGDTQISTPIHLLHNHGWISLHDQLVPFSTVNAKRLYWGKRLLRVANTRNIKSNAKEKGLRDGIEYSYRETAIPKTKSFEGKRDTQTGFKTKTKRTMQFTEEIFYGGDILLGLALSTIYELRFLGSCGFRTWFLKEFSKANVEKRNQLLGELIKGFFRVEGKYPVALRLEETLPHQLRYTSPGQSDSKNEDACLLQVDNPDGDGRYNEDLSINADDMKHALLKQEKYQLDGELSVVRRQYARFQKDKHKEPVYKAKKETIENRLEIVNKELVAYAKEDKKLQQFLSKWIKTPLRLNKISTEKMVLIRDSFSELLENELVTIEQLISATLKKLEIIADENIKQLIVDEKLELDDLIEINIEKLSLIRDYFYCLFDEDQLTDLAVIHNASLEKLNVITDEQLMQVLIDGHATLDEMLALTVTELQAFADCENLDHAFTEHNTSFGGLVDLYREDAEHLTCLTTSDLANLIIDSSPNISQLMMQYADEFDIDMDFVRDTIGEDEWMQVMTELGTEETTDEEESASEDDENDFTYSLKNKKLS